MQGSLGPVLMSQLLTLYWPKQVTLLSPKSRDQETHSAHHEAKASMWIHKEGNEL